MIVGLATTVVVYIARSVCGQNYPKCRSLNKVQNEEDGLSIDGFSERPDEDHIRTDSEQNIQNSIKNRQVNTQEGCQCFVDHTGYNHFQRRSKDDKHNYMYHKCRGRQKRNS